MTVDETARYSVFETAVLRAGSMDHSRAARMVVWLAGRKESDWVDSLVVLLVLLKVGSSAALKVDESAGEKAASKVVAMGREKVVKKVTYLATTLVDSVVAR